MVGPMSNSIRLMPLVAATTLAVTLATASWPARAEDLPDPTRPPVAQRRTPTGEAPKATAPVLQSIITGAGRKPAVIISGHALQLGESFENMKLVRVTELGATLSGPHGSTTLALTPNSDKLVASLPITEKVAVETSPGSTRRVGLAAMPARTLEQK